MRDELRSLEGCDAIRAAVSLPTFRRKLLPVGGVICNRTVIVMTVLWPYVIQAPNKLIHCTESVITTPPLLYLLGLKYHAMWATGQAAVLVMISRFESRAY